MDPEEEDTKNYDYGAAAATDPQPSYSPVPGSSTANNASVSSLPQSIMIVRNGGHTSPCRHH
jgi:hypothetical protein